MFLKKLYHFNKAAFFLLLVFLLSFIYINYKWGLTATPVYQYGMFSGKFYMKDTQRVFKIYVNDKQLDITKYSFAERDIMLITLEKYEQQAAINESVYNTIKKISGKFDLAVMQPKLYRCSVPDSIFTTWYKQMLEGIIGFPVVKLEVFEQQAGWGNGMLQEITSPQKLSFIVAD